MKLFMISALSGFWMRKMENVVTTFIKRVSVLSYSISIVCLCLARFNSITVNLTNLVMRLDFFLIPDLNPFRIQHLLVTCM